MVQSLVKLSLFSGICFWSLLTLAEGITKTSEVYNYIDDPAVSTKVVIDLRSKGKEISSAFYGAHIDSGSPAPAASLIKDLGVGMIRMGGNEYDVFNWKNGYALTESGLRTLPGFVNTAKALNQYQVPGVYQINLHGYQPELVNDNYVLKRTFTASAAADLIKTLNGKQNLGLVHFSLGNEPEQWYETHSQAGNTQAISADEYIQRYIDFALAIRKAQEEVNGNPNSIKLWGPEMSASWLDWNTGNFAKDCQWHGTNIGQVVCSYGNGAFQNFLPYFLDRVAKAEKDPKVNPRHYKLLDYFSFHYYATLRTKISDVGSIIADPDGNQWISKILESTQVLTNPNYVNNYDMSSYRKIKSNVFGRMKMWRDTYYPSAKLSLNEFAVDSDYRSTRYHPIVRPLYMADVIASAATQGIDFFNNFILNSAPGDNSAWAMIDGDRPTNLYYMYALFSNNFKGAILNTADNANDVINSYAVDADPFIQLALINKSPTDKKVQIYFQSDRLMKVATHLVPGWSSSILKIDKRLPRNGGTLDVSQFGATEMAITKDPKYDKYP
ncbi:MAG: glycoside hydrolase family 44 protein [Bdellovibrio sp.]